MKNKHTTLRKRLKPLISHLFILLFGLLMLYPVAWLLSSSVKAGETIFSDPSILPKKVTFNNYVVGWEGVGRVRFGRFMVNSTIICMITVFANVVSCSMAAYAFGRLKFTLKSLWFAIMMVSIMLPTHVTTIPRYIMFNKYGWINTYWPLIVPKMLATEAFFVFLMVQFVRGIPRDLDEAAMIEGCGKVRVFFRIIVPLMVPSMVTTALFSFLWTWDDFFNQLLYLNTPQKYTVPLGLRMFMDATGQSSWGPMFAMSVVSLIPLFILFFALQKYFVQGIATTGIKG